MKLSVLVVNANSILISLILGAVVLIFKVGLSKLFSNDSDVIEAVKNLAPLLALSILLNGIQPILSGKLSYTLMLGLVCGISNKEYRINNKMLKYDVFLVD